MKHLPAVAWRWTADRAGFVLPMTIVVLVILAAMGITMIAMSRDETLSARAMHESSLALYAAEAGIHEVYARWDSLAAGVDTLGPGDSLDLGTHLLSTGASYRAVVQRLDNGGQEMYALRVEGRGPGPLGGRRTLSYALTSAPGEPGTGYKLGECCEAPVTVRGDIDVRDASVLNGHDEHPAGWADAGVCSDSLYDKPGLIIQDLDSLTIASGGQVTGEPPLVEDVYLDDATFNDFGDLTWEQIKAMAQHVIGEPGSNRSYDAGDIHPRYRVDPMTGERLCDTSHPLNWGSPDPNDPCFNHFPVILVQGDVDLQYGVYAQGIFITDFWTDALGVHYGSELDIEDDVTFNGIVLGKGCVEVQRRANFHGAVFADSHWGNSLCAADDTFDMNDHGYMTWSQCAVDRALYNSIFRDYAEPEIPASSRAQFLGSRSYSEGVQ